MRIVEQGPGRLHLRHFPWVAGGVAAGLGLLGLYDAVADDGLEWYERALTLAVSLGALWLAWWLAPVIDVVFDREAGEVRVSERRLTGRRARRLPLGGVSGVRARARRHTTPRRTRLTLETADGPIPLEKGFGPIDRTPIAEAINAWLSNN